MTSTLNFEWNHREKVQQYCEKNIGKAVYYLHNEFGSDDWTMRVLKGQGLWQVEADEQHIIMIALKCL